jgi:hypothetical protein
MGSPTDATISRTDWLVRGLLVAGLLAGHDAFAEDRLGPVGWVVWAVAMIVSTCALLAYHRELALAPAAD